MAQPNRAYFGQVEDRWRAISLVVLMENAKGQSQVLESTDLIDLDVRPERDDFALDTALYRHGREYITSRLEFKLSLRFSSYSLTVRDVEKVEYRRDGPTGIYLPTSSFAIGADAAAFIEIGGS